MDELVDELSWDVPLRLFGGVHYLELAGIEPYALSGDWNDFRSALEARRDFLARFVREQAVQTNEVQRCFALLPAFLVLARGVRGGGARPRRARPVGRAEPALGPLRLRLPRRALGLVRAAAARRRVRAGAS